MDNIVIAEEQIKNAENMLQERYNIAVLTDERMGNKDGACFLPNNQDYIYYRACIDMLASFGLSVETVKRDGKVIHLIY